MAENKTPDARRIVSVLFDEDSFVEIGHTSSSVITGTGTIDGMQLYAFVQDISEKSGAVDGKSAAKIKRLYDLALNSGIPVAAFYNSKGGDIKESASLLDSFGGVAADMARLSGVVPQISVVLGQCSGIQAVVCRMADFVILTEEAEMYLSKSDEKGAGLADISVKNAEEAVEAVKKLIRILPQNNLEPAGNDYYELNSAEINGEMTGKELAEAVADVNSLIEIGAENGVSSFTAFGSLNWHTVGIVATDKNNNKGILSAEDCNKIADFVNTCDSFSVPVITIINTEGFEAGIRSAAKLAQVYGSASIPKINLVTGKAIGSAFISLGSLRTGTDFLIAYEKAVISPVQPEAAAVMLKSDKINVNDINTAAEEYIKNEASAEALLSKGYIDRITSPADARKVLISALDMTASKRVPAPYRKHINIKF